MPPSPVLQTNKRVPVCVRFDIYRIYRRYTVCFHCRNTHHQQVVNSFFVQTTVGGKMSYLSVSKHSVKTCLYRYEPQGAVIIIDKIQGEGYVRRNVVDFLFEARFANKDNFALNVKSNIRSETIRGKYFRELNNNRLSLN